MRGRVLSASILAAMLAADDTSSPEVPFPGDHRRQKPRKQRAPRKPTDPPKVGKVTRQMLRREARENR